MNKEHFNLLSRFISDIYKIRQEILFKEHFDRSALLNMHVSKPVKAGSVSFLHYIIQNILLCNIIYVYTFVNKTYMHAMHACIHTYIHSNCIWYEC